MDFDLSRSTQVLSRTPAVLNTLLHGLDPGWALSNYGPDTFSPFDVVGHLVHADRTNWLTRLRHILEHGESRPFSAFDRYAMYEASRGETMAGLLGTFAEVRAQNLNDLHALNLTPEDFERRGTHPQLGSVTVRQLLSSWVVHDLGHTHQIVKAMAYQYRDEVGPWREFLTILARGD